MMINLHISNKAQTSFHILIGNNLNTLFSPCAEGAFFFGNLIVQRPMSCAYSEQEILNLWYFKFTSNIFWKNKKHNLLTLKTPLPKTDLTHLQLHHRPWSKRHAAFCRRNDILHARWGGSHHHRVVSLAKDINHATDVNHVETKTPHLKLTHCLIRKWNPPHRFG